MVTQFHVLSVFFVLLSDFLEIVKGENFFFPFSTILIKKNIFSHKSVCGLLKVLDKDLSMK